METLTPLDEQQLIAALQAGREAAFRQLVEQYQTLVLNTCLGFVPHLQDAEDLTQEVFIEVYRSVGRFRGEAKLSTWLYRIAVTKCLEYRRYRRRDKRRAFFQSLVGLDTREAQEQADAFNHPGLALENQERGRIIFAQIDRLPDNQRIAFILHKVEQLSHREIAEIMDSSIPAVESLIHRAKKKLQEYLEGYYRQEMLDDRR